MSQSSCVPAEIGPPRATCCLPLNLCAPGQCMSGGRPTDWLHWLHSRPCPQLAHLTRSKPAARLQPSPLLQAAHPAQGSVRLFLRTREAGPPTSCAWASWQSRLAPGTAAPSESRSSLASSWRSKGHSPQKSREVPPSTRGTLRRWLRCARAVLQGSFGCWARTPRVRALQQLKQEQVRTKSRSCMLASEGASRDP